MGGGGKPAGRIPVSYTHLDVYKRQPAGLVGNWQNELRELFGMEFAVVTGADLAARNSNPFSTGPNCDHVICSVDTLRGERAFLRLAEAGVMPYDLVVFDLSLIHI